MNGFSVLKEKILNRSIKISVVGLGYVGLPLALRFTEEGFSVWGIDVDEDRIKKLKRRESYITDVSQKYLSRCFNTKRFKVTTNFKAISETQAILICVPTPLKYKYTPNISYIEKAVVSIAKNINKPSLLILESTTYPGTTEEVILPLLEKYNLKHNEDFFLCFSPERIDPGNKKYNLKNIPKIVGGLNHKATELATLLYKCIIDEVYPVNSTRVAEFVKLLENTFRLVNIALIYELTMMAYKMNVDIWKIIELAKTKPFGFMPFYPGPGVGGHCIPKDPIYLYWKSRQHGFNLRFIKLASEIISYMPRYIVERVVNLLDKNKKQPKILIVGVTYKKDVKDLRKSPALDIIQILQKQKVKVSYYDPLIPYLKIDQINLKSIKLTKDVLNKFDCVVIVTDHSKINYNLILKNAELIFDTRNVYKDIDSEKIVRL